VFAEGTWAGDWRPDFAPQAGDVMVREHWGSSGFANTDLDVHLEQRGFQKLILIGMLADTRLETTGKFGVELGYHVTQGLAFAKAGLEAITRRSRSPPCRTAAQTPADPGRQ
jgi:hypothetical protein